MYTPHPPDLPADTEQTLYELAAPDTDPAVLAARDPTKIGFPAMLPMELALKIDKPNVVCQAYGIDKKGLEALMLNAHFVKAYADAVEMLKIDGMSFKVKARMQAEELLKTSYKMITNVATADSVRADLIKSTVRWAGWDAKAAEVGQGASFAIQINLG